MHGTFRNKVSKLIKQGVVCVLYYSKLAFYCLKGLNPEIVNRMIHNHMVVPQTVTAVTESIGADKLLSYVSTLDNDADSIHDIHTKFTVPGIYNLVSRNLTYSKAINFMSKDIKLDKLFINHMRLCITIHRTGTVTVSVACSRFPIMLNEDGLDRLSYALEVARKRLISLVKECGGLLDEKGSIPDYWSWLVTLWHFGKDRFQNEHAAKGYALTWARGCEVLRCYLKGKDIHRAERQESPKKCLADALKEKMDRAQNE